MPSNTLKANGSTLNVLQQAYREVGIGNPRQLGLENFFVTTIRPAIAKVLEEGLEIKGVEESTSETPDFSPIIKGATLSDLFKTLGVQDLPAAIERIVRAQIMATYRAKIGQTVKPVNLDEAAWLFNSIEGAIDVEPLTSYVIIAAIKFTLFFPELLT